MGADNWAFCPKCKSRNEERHAKQVSDWKDSYGKVPQEEYDANRPPADPPAINTTLREDYELGITECGRFYLNYQADCHECDFSFKTKIDKDTLVAC